MVRINKEDQSVNLLDYRYDPQYSKSDYGLGKQNKARSKTQSVNKVKKGNKT